MCIDLGESLLFTSTSNQCIPFPSCKEESRGIQLLSTHQSEYISQEASIATPITCRKKTPTQQLNKCKRKYFKTSVFRMRVSLGHITFMYCGKHQATQPDSDLHLSAKFIISQECHCQGKFSSQLHLTGLSSPLLTLLLLSQT